MTPDLEWLEADGLGGFASGTSALVRTRRYHALLMRSGPPSHRFVLVNGCDVFLTTPEGRFALSAQRYQPGVTSPDGTVHLESFAHEPWPVSVFRLPGGRTVRQEIFVPHARAAAVLSWKLEGEPTGCLLEVRPFLSGRDPHALQHANDAFNFIPDSAGDLLRWQPYPGVPAITIASNGEYRHEPYWYRDFLYETERSRGLDDTEDLAAPGVFTWNPGAAEAVLILASPSEGEDYGGLGTAPAGEVAAQFRAEEAQRRAAFPSPLLRAAEAYLVRRGHGHSIIAGYPWFTDWGRDTFIALRGLCLATGRLEVARSILLEWAETVSEGMLPNFFPEGGRPAEYNSVDASLWYVIAVHDYLEALSASGQKVRPLDRKRLAVAIEAILEGYARGTRYGIRADHDGLLFAGQTGLQLTWMDAKVGDWVVTPRIGKPVEIQALWINALLIGARFNPQWIGPAARAQKNFLPLFWNEELGCLHDVADVDFVPGRKDRSLRPNQIFAVGGLPVPLLQGKRAASVVRAVEEKLLTPLGLRTLSPDHPDYHPFYRGGPRERDGAYHQGSVWPWLIGPFVEAWVRVRDPSAATRAAAAERFLTPLRRHLAEAGLGHVSEIADGDAPHVPGGCPFQAWSLGELLRLELQVLAPAARPLHPLPTPVEFPAPEPVRP